MLLAVTERASGLKLADKDVFVATVGGARLGEPGVDLAVAMAVVSAGWDTPVPPDVLAIGEVALSGDVRRVSMLPQRVAEAARLGYQPDPRAARLARAAGHPAGGRAGHRGRPRGARVQPAARAGGGTAGLVSLPAAGGPGSTLPS